MKASCERASNPEYVIGYCWTDPGACLDNSTGNNWVDFIKSPSRCTWATGVPKFEHGMMTELHHGTSLSSFHRTRILSYRWHSEQKVRPDHLIFGDRFSFQTFNPAIVEEMLPYVDAIAVQPYFMESFPQQNLMKLSIYWQANPLM